MNAENRIRPVCFMVMPFGMKETGITDGLHPSKIDFDNLWHKAFEPAIKEMGYSPVRADFDLGSDIIHDMLERLTLADLIIADLTLGNPNVYYEIGLRHGIKKTGCVLIASDWVGPFFDLEQFRRVTYPLNSLQLTESDAKKIQSILVEAVPTLAKSPSPLYELAGYPDIDISRAKSFRDVVSQISTFQARINALREAPRSTREDGIKKFVAEFTNDKTGPGPLIRSVAIELLYLVRDCLGWQENIDYIESLPEDISRLPIVQEQYWLARSKMGEPLDAIGALKELVKQFGDSAFRQGLIAGRYKRLYFECDDPVDRQRFLNEAISHYEKAMYLDLNDHCSSSNLPTLLRERGHKGDAERAQAIDHLAILSCERSIKLNIDDKWAYLTLLGIAFDEGDIDKAWEMLEQILEHEIVSWEIKTTFTKLEHSLNTISDEIVRTELSAILDKLRVYAE